MVIRAPGPRGTQAGSYAELDDRMLVLDFQAGQIEAFVEIHHRYGALARHVCGRFLPNSQDVDEALQETWIRVFQGLHRFNGRFALQSWVARIATNVSLDILRARARRPQLDDQPIDEHEREDGTDGPEEEVERLIQRDMVIAVLAGLPDSHRRALVLRELEGRSHKEIAGELDISPAQAKALIHRAKGTFRREWLRAATDRHGLAGFLLLPVIWLSKLGGLARKVADRTAEAVQVGGSEVVTHAAQAASAPVVPVAASAATSVSQVGERIVAAGLTLLVAGGVTVGAATIARDRSDRDKPEAVIAAPVQTRSEDPSPTEPVVAKDQVEEKVKGLQHEEATRGDEETDAAAPVEGPSASPTVDPSASPSGEPSPDASPSAIPPAPAWTFTFTSSNDSIEVCECDGSTLVSSIVVGEAGDDVAFSQKIEGTALDASGDATWGYELALWGTAGPTGGRIEYRFTLHSVAGAYSYTGAAALAETGQDTDTGSFTYKYYGTYQVDPDAEVYAGIPAQGFASASISIWPDGTIYLGSLALTEAA